jgi:hypothetical protein
MHVECAARFQLGKLNIMSNSFHVRKFVLCTGQVVKTDELQQYPRSHIIGEVCYIGLSDQARKFASLALYEMSVSVDNVPETTPEIRADVLGDARNIRCTCCRHKRRWDITRAALLQRMALFEIPA